MDTTEEQGAGRHEVQGETLPDVTFLNKSLGKLETKLLQKVETSQKDFDETQRQLQLLLSQAEQLRAEIEKLSTEISENDGAADDLQNSINQTKEEFQRLNRILSHVTERAVNIANELAGIGGFDGNAVAQKRELVINETEANGLDIQIKKLEKAAKEARDLLDRILHDNNLTLRFEVKIKEHAAEDWLKAERALQQSHFEQKSLQSRLQELFDILLQFDVATDEIKTELKQKEDAHRKTKEEEANLDVNHSHKIKQLRELEETTIPEAEATHRSEEDTLKAAQKDLARVQVVMSDFNRLTALFAEALDKKNLAPELAEKLRNESSKTLRNMVLEAENELSIVQPGKGIMTDIGVGVGKWQNRLESAAEEISSAEAKLDGLIAALKLAVEQTANNMKKETDLDLAVLENAAQQAKKLEAFLQNEWLKLRTPEHESVNAICEQARRNIERSLAPLKVLLLATTAYREIQSKNALDDKAAPTGAFDGLRAVPEETPEETPEEPAAAQTPIEPTTQSVAPAASEGITAEVPAAAIPIQAIEELPAAPAAPAKPAPTEEAPSAEKTPQQQPSSAVPAPEMERTVIRQAPTAPAGPTARVRRVRKGGLE